MIRQGLLGLCLGLAAVTFADAGFWSVPAHDSVAEETDETTDSETVDVPVEYGVDVSFPIHHPMVSTNYAWLPHNTDPAAATPKKLQDMVVQPLGDRETFYKNFIDGCVESFGSRGRRCIQNESDRVAMSLRQPQSMQVRVAFVNGSAFLIHLCRLLTKPLPPELYQSWFQE